MSMPFYVAPEQQMKDRADFARKGIARGRSVIVMHYADGILFVAENRSQALHKVSEIYDRLGFAAVGRYNEFENLRTAGIRYADLRGYSYDRTDVTGRGLANAYAQLLGTIFSSGGDKPYEVEIIVAELGATQALDQIYRLTYDGSVGDEQNFAVMGGSADVIADVVKRGFKPNLSLPDAAKLAVRSLSSDGGPNVEPRKLGVEALEVAILDRTRLLPRKFRRIRGDRLAALLDRDVQPEDPGHVAPAVAAPEPALAERELAKPADPSPGAQAGQPSPGNPSS
jgi:proteasome alpha subunit